SLSARYDETAAGAPLSGSAEMTDFRVLKAPGLARVLQAMTLYGLAQVLEGPGLRFSKLIAPFRLADDRLDLVDARAYNPSLGLTVKGSVDLEHRVADLSGTIVPAYFFNSLLGNIPLVGRLFSPEKGGGLFAAAYTIDGPLDDPKVNVNPLAAITPGFLRGLFSMFNEKHP
ncbi:MAG TPA: AsmA-like C-terminal region-containing protein, partial [Acetobacteraceae bacterium]|nr:AsmA-like C-terminal region-containing protein [Acetobacteraceae bacterium]